MGTIYFVRLLLQNFGIFRMLIFNSARMAKLADLPAGRQAR
jgi:hypothetical protein